MTRSESTQSVTTIWDEDFSSPVTLASGDATKTSVQSGKLVSSDDEAVWTSQMIDISGYTDVKIAVDLSSAGTLEDDDYLQVYYELNGGPDEIPLLNGRWFGNVSPTTAMIGDLNGSSVQIIVKFRTDDAAEEYAIDNARVYTEPSERHAIQNGNWNAGSTWSYTSGGGSCSCVPDQLSDTYVDGHTVSISTDSNTRHLTVNGGGTLQWTTNTRNLRLWGDAVLNVELGSEIIKGAVTDTYISFNQWNYRSSHGVNQTPVALGYPGVSASINVNQPSSFLISELQINAAGNFIIQGTGNLPMTRDIEVSHEANVTNNLVGNLTVDDLNLNFPSVSFTNNQNIQVGDDLKLNRADITFANNANLTVGGDLILDGDNITFTNDGDLFVNNTLSINQSDNAFINQKNLEVNFNLILDAINNTLLNSATGSIEVKTGTLQIREASEVINEGDFETSYLATNAVSNGGGQITNRQTFKVHNDIFTYGKPLTIYNYGTVAIDRDVSLAVDEKLSLYNYEDANWYFGGNVSPLIKLYAGAANNTIHYDGAADQSVITPQDSYWHLTLANISTTGTSSLKRSIGNAMDINGNLTMIGTATGPVDFDVNTNDTDINIAGDWEQVNSPHVAYERGDNDETVTFDGSGDQALRSNESFQNVAINKSGGRVLMPEGARVSQKATFVDGIVTTNGNSLVFRDLSQAIGASDNSHVLGPVTKQGNTDFTFPVGDGTDYRPLGLSGLDVASDFTVEYHHTNPTGDGYAVSSVSSLLLNVSGCEYWEVERIGTAEAFITLTWDDTSCPVDVNDLTIVRWDGTQWVAVPSTATGIASITSNTRLSTFGIFTLTERNDVPQATNDAATTQEGISVEINVPQNDFDRNGIDPATVSVVAAAQHGTASVDATTGIVTYLPNADFAGKDSLRYTIRDIKGLASNEATVVIVIESDDPAPTQAVNTAPMAQPDAFVTNEDQALSGNLASNDTDQEQDALAFTLDLDHLPAHGDLAINPNGTFIYTPDTNFVGGDQFVYQACDDGNPSRCDTALVTISVLPVNDAPVAIDDAFTVVESDTIIANVAVNDTDPEGDPLGDVSLLTAPANGSVTLEPSGRFTYEPDRYYVGTDQFSYRICDDQNPSLCDEAEVTIQIQVGLLNVPKAFSPNQDQINDDWIIPGIRAYPNNTVAVFNRWGNAVYRARSYDNQTTRWQGEARQGIVLGNQPLPEGTYFYVIDLGEGRKPMSGYVLLKR